MAESTETAKHPAPPPAAEARVRGGNEAWTTTSWPQRAALLASFCSMAQSPPSPAFWTDAASLTAFTLPRWTSRRARRAVEGFVETLIAAAPTHFIMPLFEALHIHLKEDVRIGTSKSRTPVAPGVAPLDLVAVLRVTIVALTAMTTEALANIPPKRRAGLVNLQLRVLRALPTQAALPHYARVHKAMTQAQRRWTKLVAQHGTILVPAYLDAVVPTHDGWLLHALAHATRKMKPTATTAAVRTALTKHYETLVLSASAPLGTDALLLDAFAPFVASLSHDECAHTLQPTIERLAKRATDALTANVLVPLCTHSALDMSRYAGPIWIDVLLGELRSDVTARRTAATTAMKALFARISDPTVLQSWLDAILACVAGQRHGVVVQWECRCALLHALQASAGNPAMATLAASFIPQLVEFMATSGETQVNVLVAGVEALTAWIMVSDEAPEFATFVMEQLRANCGMAAAAAAAAQPPKHPRKRKGNKGAPNADEEVKVPPPPTSRYTIRTLGDKVDLPVLAAYMRLCLVVLQSVQRGATSTSCHQAVAALVTGLTSPHVVHAFDVRIQVAQTNAAYREVALLALALSFRSEVAKAYHTVVDGAPTHKYTSLLAAEDSFLARADSMLKAGPREGAAFAELTGSVLSVANVETPPLTLVRGIIIGSLHSDGRVAKAIVDRAAAAFGDKARASRFSGAFAMAFAGVMVDRDTIFSGAGIPPAPEGWAWQHSFCRLACHHPNARVLPLVGILAHHAVFRLGSDMDHLALLRDASRVARSTRRGIRRARVWQAVTKRWRLMGFDTDVELRKCMSALNVTMFDAASVHGLFGGDGAAPFRDAALAFASRVAFVAPNEWVEHILPTVTRLLQTPTVLAATPYESAVYATPRGVVCEWSESGVYKAKAVVSTNVKRKGKLYSAEDEAWEREMKAKAAAKKNKSKVDPKEAALLKEQDAIRDKLMAGVRRVEAGLDLLFQLASLGNRWHGAVAQSFVHDCVLERILPCVHQLLRTTVVREGAVRVHQALATCMLKPLSSSHLLLARAARMAVAKGDALWREDYEAQTVNEAVRGIYRACATLPLEPLDEEEAAMAGDAGGDMLLDELMFFPSPSFAFVFPILKTRVMNATASKGSLKVPAKEDEEEDDARQDAYRVDADMPTSSVTQAIHIVCAHCRIDAALYYRKVQLDYPRVHMVSLLLYCVANLQVSAAEGTSALTRLAPSLTGPAEYDPLIRKTGVMSSKAHVRCAALDAIRYMRCLPSRPPHDPSLLAALFVATHDQDQAVRDLARALWDDSVSFGFRQTEAYAKPLLMLLDEQDPRVRLSVARAISTAMMAFPVTATSTFEELQQLFLTSPDVIPAAAVGRARRGGQTESVIRAPIRSGVLLCIRECATSVETKAPQGKQSQLLSLFHFIVNHGLADAADEVWSDALDAGLRLIEVHASTSLDALLSRFEVWLAELRTTRRAELRDDAMCDRMQEGVVVLLGTLSKYLPAKSSKVSEILLLLIDVLSTPSYSVQASVAKCISPLMKFVKAEGGDYVELLLGRLSSPTAPYGERMGAAFGLAACVKGLKLSSLKKYDVLDALTACVTDTKNKKARLGALLAYQRLFVELGSRFEPYVVHVLPHILNCFGDGDSGVREATQSSARAMMAALTAHGVKILLPLVLRSLDDPHWRTKLQSILLLGEMGHCAPKQLGLCLPQIVPRLLEAITDPHEKVQNGCEDALQTIGSVIRSPEIASLLPSLIDALNNPTSRTYAALEALINTSFVHRVDAPSLALVVPIVRRGFKSRSQKEKRMAAQVVGSMCSLIADVNDLRPYTSTLFKYLKIAIVDANPEVRGVSSRAMASLFENIKDDDTFSGLTDWLLGLLRQEDTVSVQRDGAAQALSHVLRTMGIERLQQLLPEIRESLSNHNASVREGYMSLLIYVPEAFGRLFHTFVPEVLPWILQAVDDSHTVVRDAALRAGMAMAVQFARTHKDAVMPALVVGMKSTKWRVRQSALQILGAFMLASAGVTSRAFTRVELNDEDTSDVGTVATAAQDAIIRKTMGEELHGDVMATVYLLRSDAVVNVRQMAWRVWKAGIAHTGRTLTRILPIMVEKIIYDLASEDDDEQQTAAAALGDLVGKQGEAILTQIVPLLQERMNSPDNSARQGVCTGLSEVIRASRKSYIGAFLPDLIPAIRDALCDVAEEVRASAGVAFSTLVKSIGNRAVDEVLPALLGRFEDTVVRVPAAEREAALGVAIANAGTGEAVGGVNSALLVHVVGQKAAIVLEGIRTILKLSPVEVMLVLFRRWLIMTPRPDEVDILHVCAVALLAEDFGHGFHRYVSNVVELLIDECSRILAHDDAATKTLSTGPKMGEGSAHFRVLMAAAERLDAYLKVESVPVLVQLLSGRLAHGADPYQRVVSARLLASFCSCTKESLISQVSPVLTALLALYAANEEVLRVEGWTAVSTVISVMTVDVLAKFVDQIRGIVFDLAHDRRGNRVHETVPALAVRHGVAPLLPVYQHALMHGTPRHREEAAHGIRELLELSSEKAMSPFVIKLTGPLIRVVGDRFSPEVRVAILRTLCLLLQKSGRFVRPFLPQLQTTFVKAVNDLDESVRGHGVEALSHLAVLSRRIDPLLNEILKSARASAHSGVRASLLQTLSGMVARKEVIERSDVAVIASLRAAAEEFLTLPQDGVRTGAANLLAGTLAVVDDADFGRIVGELLDEEVDGDDNFAVRDGRLRAMKAVLEQPASLVKLEESGLLDSVIARSVASLGDDNVAVRLLAVQLATAVLLRATVTSAHVASLLRQLVKLLDSDSVLNVRVTAADAMQAAAEQRVIPNKLVPPLVASLWLQRDAGNSPLRSSVNQALIACVCCVAEAVGGFGSKSVVETAGASLAASEQEEFKKFVSKTAAKQSGAAARK